MKRSSDAWQRWAGSRCNRCTVAQATGHRIHATFKTVSVERERVEKGERPDVVIVSRAAIAQLNKLGLINAARIRDIGDVWVGLAGKAASNLRTSAAVAWECGYAARKIRPVRRRSCGTTQ